jgi:hypothetical protein
VPTIAAVILGAVMVLSIFGFPGGTLHKFFFPKQPIVPPANKTSPNNFITYENSTFGIKIQYPPSWYTSTEFVPANNSKPVLDYGIVSFFPRSKSDLAGVKLFVNSLNDTKSVAEYLSDTSVAYRNKIPHFKPIESTTNSTLAMLPAYRLTYTSAYDYRYSPEVDRYKVLEIGTIIAGGKVYYIQYTNDPKQFDNDLPIVQKMINSFQITAHPQLGNQTFTYDGGYQDGFSDAQKGLDENFTSDEPYAMGYRDGHRAGLKQVEVNNSNNISQSQRENK